ncbi:hypothetical protein [Acidovorax sp. NCPPB 3576]|uniref:hypothetical protein n=1 Tax=Acidovorax sp. NCPPB 3576 TaxID=2940488 RepID=UPI00234A2877|nr:hypothetical protein [Acidovorax sp. NCPPB 3576]WCM88830.1 hypothetical protein M5C98_01885 [Acidovorax sp. NCPPB 3576]
MSDTPTQERPNLSERLTSAGNSSDLSVRTDARGDADYLIAAGTTPARLGRYIYSLMAEYDACAKPRPITDDAVRRMSKEVSAADEKRWKDQLPALKLDGRGRPTKASVEARKMAAARLELNKWLAGERRRVLGRLHSLPKLMDPHSGLLPWVVARGGSTPEGKLLDVLGWWADRLCPSCSGTKKQGGRTCTACRGVGLREIPHGKEGQAISEHIAAQVDRSRRGIKNGLPGLRQLKSYAAGQDGGRNGL